MSKNSTAEVDLVEVHRSRGGPAVVEVIRSTLAAEGILCFIKSESTLLFGPNMEGPLSEFRVLVREVDASRASELLRTATEVDDQDDEDLGSDEYHGVRRFLRPRPQARTSPVLAFGLVGAALVGGAIFDLSRGGVLWLPLFVFAGLCALAARRSHH